MDAWRIYSAVKRHKYLVVLSVLITTAAAIIVTLFLPRYYVATATLLPSEAAIRRNLQSSADTDQDQSQIEASPRDSRMANFVVLAKSRTVMDRVSLRVHISPRILMRRVDIDRIYKSESGVGTDMIAISAKLNNPETSVGVANVWAEEFVKFYEEVSHRDAVQAREFLEGLLKKARKQLNLCEADLSTFRKRHSITDLPIEINAAMSELAPLRSERDDLRARVAEINARLSTRKTQLRIVSPTRAVKARETPAATIDALRKSIGASKAELIRLSQTYTDDYYRVKELRQQINAAQAELDRQVRHLDTVVKVVDDPSYQKILGDVSDLEADSRAGQARLARLDSLITNREAKLGSYAGIDLPLADKRRAYDEAEKRYASLANQVHNARINERISTETGAVKLIDAARSAEGPLRAGPSVVQLIIAAILLGLLFGAGVVMAVEALDTRVRTVTDASDLMELPVTGVIPSIPSMGDLRPSAALVTQNSPMSPFAESYRFLATEVLLDAPAGNIKSIMVATAKPSQGGTSTICNLAITLSQAGHGVVLVDADLRRPSLHRMFGIPNDYGLADLLRNSDSAASAVKVTGVENLGLITAGTNIDNPWALLKSANMSLIIEELKHNVDYVLVDVPSAIVFADAAIMASIVDGVIVVVRANESARGSEFQIKGLLNKANANIMGVVLNDVPPTDVDNCHYYANYYATPSLLKPRVQRGATVLSGDEFTWNGDDSRGDSEDNYALDEDGRP